MSSVDQTIVSTALPALTEDLNAPIHWSAWTITVYALGQIVALPLAGKLSDVYGRKHVFLGSVVLFTVASLCCGLAPNIQMLVVLRAAQALGGGAFLPSATGIVADEFVDNRDRAVGLFSTIFPLGGIVGPILGGIFVSFWSWRWIFLVNVPVGILLLIVGQLVIRSGGSEKSTERVDVISVLLLAVTLASLMVGISNFGAEGAVWFDAQILLPVCLAVIAGWWFVRRSNASANPYIPMWMFYRGSLGVLNFANFLFGACALGFGALVPLYALSRYDLTTLQSGTLLTARAIGMMLCAAVAAMTLQRFGYRRPIYLGTVIASVGLLVMALPPLFLPPYWWLSLGAGLTGVGMGTLLPASNNAVLQIMPNHTAGVTGLRSMFRQCGGMTAISISTAVLSRSADHGLALAYVFGVFACVLFSSLLLVRWIPDSKGSW